MQKEILVKYEITSAPALHNSIKALKLKGILDEEGTTKAAIPAEECRIAERGFSAGSVCDECVAEATDEKQNEADGNPQPAILHS